MKKKLGFIVPLIGGWILLSGWGYSGHVKISEGAAKSFDPKMSQFHAWTQIIADHSSDADKRKSWDSSEGIKHYIDIDNYTIFVNSGSIYHDKDSMIDRYGAAFVEKQGVLPWTTKTTYDTLVNCFTRGDFDKAVLTAADLSHYVGDGHMPLHITYNYDGQYTNNKGIHSRYESSMISRFVNQIEFEGEELYFIDDVNNYIFDYLYASYPYVDSILLADNYAQSINAVTTSTAYLEALWEKTEAFTDKLFADASFSLANLIYTAWMTAGAPSFNNQTFSSYVNQSKLFLESIYCNYTDSALIVDYSLQKEMTIGFSILALDGKELKKTTTGTTTSGTHQIAIDISGLSNGMYLLIMTNGKGHAITQKFALNW